MSKPRDVKVISSLEEVAEPDVRYRLEGGDRWVQIELEPNAGREYGYNANCDVYVLNYHFWDYQLYDFATNGGRVRSWKTFEGCRRYLLKKYSQFV